MYVIVEIPHTKDPICWFAVDSQDLIDIVNQSGIDTFESAMEHITKDLHSAHIYYGLLEACKAYANRDIRGHQHIKALESLRKTIELLSNNIDEDLEAGITTYTFNNFRLEDSEAGGKVILTH